MGTASTPNPSRSPSNSPSNSPSSPPSNSPSNSPSISPSNPPSESPSNSPTESPSKSPSESPTTYSSNPLDLWSGDIMTEPIGNQSVDELCPSEMSRFVAWSARKWWMVYAAVFSIGFIIGSSLLAVVVVTMNRYKSRGGREYGV